MLTTAWLIAVLMVPPCSLAAPGDENWSGIFAAAGVNGTVYALATDGQGNLYPGGAFTTAGGKPSHRMAQWVSPASNV